MRCLSNIANIADNHFIKTYFILFQTDTKTISKMSKGTIDLGESEVWNDPFVLPAMPPSEMRGRSYIDISYYLRVSFSILL